MTIRFHRSSAALALGALALSTSALAQEAAQPGAGGSLSLSGEAGTSGVAAESSAESKASAPEAAAPSAAEPAAAEPTVAAPAAAEPTVAAPPAPVIPPYAGARANRDPHPYDADSRFAAVPYMQRFKPTGNLWEIGLFAGMFLPASSHNLLVNALPREEYSSPNIAWGGRAAYFPLSFVGVEVEGMTSAGSTQTTDRSALFYSVRGHGVLQLPFWSIVPFATVGGGVLGAVSEPMGHDGDPLFHWGLGVKAPFNRLVSMRFDFRDDITQQGDGASQGTAAHSLELLLGVTVTFDRKAPPAPQDRDYDGLFDSEDKCPDQGALTTDGCPLDGDADGVLDQDDECPREAGPAPLGCPDRDADKDGVPVPADQCPDEPGEAPSGCPVTDADGDGIIEGDKCPDKPETRNGFEDADGCPDEVPEAIKRFTGVMRGINFKQGTAEVDKASYPTLDSAVEVLQKYDSIRLEVSGHTSSEGTEARNQELSEQRANAVRDYIVGKGVAEDRVVARGAGPSEPIADNATKEGKAENRRIEFRVLAQP